MKKGWEVKRLEEVANVGAGNSAPQSKELFENGMFPFFRTSDVGQIRKGFIATSIDYLNEKGIKGLKLFQKGTILFPKSGASTFLNHRVMMNVDGYVSSHLATIKAKSQILDDRFLLYYLITIDAKDLMQDIAYPSLKTSDIGLIPIPLPPLSEQMRIVTILDEAFAAIDKAKANAKNIFANAKELFESYLNGIFADPGEDWQMLRLEDISNVFSRGKSKHRPRNWEGLFGGDYPFIQTGEIRNAKKYVTEYTQTYNKVGLSQSKMWKKGTICITIAANIAETAILGFDSCFPDSIIGLDVNPKKADLDFTYYMLQFFKSELQSMGKGSAQDNINLGTFENQYFPFPNSIEEQKSIVNKLDTIHDETNKFESIITKKIAILEELKKSVLKKAFEGEL